MHFEYAAARLDRAWLAVIKGLLAVIFTAVGVARLLRSGLKTSPTAATTTTTASLINANSAATAAA
jgi:hypothetical protein